MPGNGRWDLIQRLKGFYNLFAPIIHSSVYVLLLNLGVAGLIPDGVIGFFH